MADIELSERAVERLRDLDTEPRERIKKKLEDIGDWPDHYLEPLSDSDAYKLRVGDYRVIIDWDREGETLYVLTLGHRRNVYDREF
jgi:mRNA interferase RelE/StbE